MTSAENAAQIILKDRMNVKKDEKVLIITDDIKKEIGELFLNQASEIADAELTEIPVGKMHGEEPPKETAEKMLHYDVIIIATDKSLSHTTARKNATEAGARIASMPEITKDILERAIDVDYKKMKKIEVKLKEIINNGNNVTLLTQKGSMITFSIKDRKAFGGTYGECTTQGAWANFPTGEVFIAPVERTADGVYIIDGSVGGIGELKKPIKIIMEKGYAVKITGDVEAEKLKHILDKCGKEAFQLAEFGIGTNPGAKIGGVVLEDEKVIGTCHLALGSNFSFGGNIKVNCHIDGIIKNPTIMIDNKKIMSKGKFLI
jgi:leucyl aminopeptidase (aminopeptidase T)